jgi:hypothetical protein
MFEGFQPRRGGGAVATLSALEADLLRSLAAQMIELLRSEEAVQPTDADPLESLLDFDGPTTVPDDPVLARLFPSAYRDDEESAADFRRFTETQLRDGKAMRAVGIIETLEEAGLPQQVEDEQLVIDVELEAPDATEWMKAITDLRLALGVRLGVEQDDEDFWDALPDDDPRVHVHDIYDWLAFLQETLVRALSKG